MKTKRSLIIGIALLLGAGPAAAADYTWTGGGAAGVWTDPDNWYPATGYPDDAGDTAAITNTADDIDAPAGLTLGALTLNEDYTGTLTLGGDLTIPDATHSGNLTVNAGTLQTGKDIESGITVSNIFAIGASGTVIVRRSYAPHPHDGHGGYGQLIVVGNLTVDGTLHADGQGFAGQQGPGAAPGIAGSRDGGSYGGRGGDSGTEGLMGPTYGCMINPVSLGSGGHLSGNDNAAGGGAMIIAATGTVTVAGTVSANGKIGSASSVSAGSGGSINISAATLAGAGTIRANGGSQASYGRGAGGRISLNGVVNDAFTGTLTANGGYHTGAERGYAGTIYLNTERRSHLVLGGPGNLQSLRLGTDDTMTPGSGANYVFGAITIQDGGTLEIDGNPSLNDWHGGAAVMHTDEIEIQDGGVLRANGLGFPSTRGPGATVYDTSSRNGASYGGRGADHNAKDDVPPTYGSITNPVVLGSGGIGWGDAAGGAIILAVTNTLTVNGGLSANGIGASASGAGGSGGSILITADTLEGTGTIQANGGTPGSSYGSGGGGRIAVYTPNLGGAAPDFEVFGGSRSGQEAAAGTIYRRHTNHGDAGGETLVANPHTTGANIVTDIPSVLAPSLYLDELAATTVHIKDNAVVNLTAALTIGNLDVSDGAAEPRLLLNGYTLTVRALKPAGWDAIEATAVRHDGGIIIWARPGTLMTLR